MEVKIHRADRKDVHTLQKMAEQFFYESDFAERATIRIDRWKDTVYKHIENPNCAALVATVDGEYAGYILIYRQCDYTEEWVGEMFQFYVREDYRGTIVARALVKAACNQYDEWDCIRVYAEASSGINMNGYPKVFSNLFAKFGFKEAGVVMKREA